MVEQIGNVDVDLVADRDDAGEADAALGGPIDHAGRNCARLRDQREIAGARHVRGETGIEAHTRHHDAQAIGPDQPHAMFPGRRDRPILQRPRSVAEPGRYDQGACRTETAGLTDDSGNVARRRGDHDELGDERQFGEAVHCGDAVDLRVARVHQAELALELSFANVLQDGASDGRPTGLAPTSATERGDNRFFRR